MIYINARNEIIKAKKLFPNSNKSELITFILMKTKKERHLNLKEVEALSEELWERLNENIN